MLKTVIAFFKKEPLRLTVFYIVIHILIYFISQLFSHDYHVIYCSLDDIMPFIPAFVIPYVIWYVFMFAAMVYPVISGDRLLLWREAAITYLGMFICIVTCIVYPTTFPGRPELGQAPFHDFFKFGVSVIYSADKPVNVFPSMHCFGSFASHLVLSGTPLYKKHKWVHCLSGILVFGICLSTCMIKQHSVLDFFASLVIVGIVCIPGYLFVPKYVKEGIHQ